MARIRVNNECNVVTDEHSTSYAMGSSNAEPPRPQITIPGWAKRLDVVEAERMATSLMEAAQKVREIEESYYKSGQWGKDRRR